MALRYYAATLCVAALTAMIGGATSGDELLPAAAKIKTDRPRVLLRPNDTPHAISRKQLKSIPRDDDFKRMLAQLRSQDDAAAQAMVYLLTDDAAAADKAIRKMRGYKYPGRTDTFHIYFRLSEFALAYDWLYDYDGFSDEMKAEVRANVLPLAQAGLRQTDDHVFHNYIWMSAGGTALWALATVGEDDQADRLYEGISRRMNRGLFPAMRYLDGLPCEPMGYWALYDLTPAALAVLAAQSASETDLVGTIRGKHNDWLSRHFENLVHSTLPNMRYIPWGDLQSGPNGGVTHEMAGAIDGLTWALKSPHGAFFSRRLAQRRGLRRFYGPTAIYYMLYTRHLQTRPAEPPLSFLAGGKQSGHVIARSSWDDGATIVAFRCTDHFGDHNHYDQGQFTIYRNGLLAVDPPVYRHIRGPQQKTEHHNTLLLGGKPQRPVRGQWFTSVEQFQKNLNEGRKLETGDLLFFKEADTFTALAARFDQAYDEGLVSTCVRQLLFVRPDKVVVVDHLAAAAEGKLPEVQWLVQFPRPPTVDGHTLSAGNGKSWIRCRPLPAAGPAPAITATPVNTHAASYRYRAERSLRLVHLLEVGDGEKPGEGADVPCRRKDGSIEIVLGGKTYVFAVDTPFAVTCP